MATNDYQEFNNFQTAFYTNIETFGDYSRFEYKRFGYQLLNNLAKGFPNLAGIVINLRGLNWSGAESPAIMRALQRNFVNNFNRPALPQFIYFKNLSEKKTDKKSAKNPKSKVLAKKGHVFDSEIQSEICSIMRIDSKTYEYLLFSDNIQKLGMELIGEFQQKEKLKKTRKTKTSKEILNF